MGKENKKYDVQILNYTDVKEMQRQIEIGLADGYSLHGSVTTGRNDNGSFVYVATMVKDKSVTEVWENVQDLIKAQQAARDILTQQQRGR